MLMNPVRGELLEGPSSRVCRVAGLRLAAELKELQRQGGSCRGQAQRDGRMTVKGRMMNEAGDVSSGDQGRKNCPEKGKLIRKGSTYKRPAGCC